MKLRSKGLGRKELVMDFREYTVTRDGPEVLVTGQIKEPVKWDFSIRISQDDIPGMLKIGLNRHALRLIVRWVLHLKPETIATPTAPARAGVAAATEPDLKSLSRKERRAAKKTMGSDTQSPEVADATDTTNEPEIDLVEIDEEESE